MNELIKFQSAHRGDLLGEKYETPDGRLIRRVSNQNKRNAMELFDTGLVDKLMEENLVPHVKIVENSNSEYLLIEEERIPYVIYPYEWSFYMLYIAGKTILRINRIALQYGYQISDPHAYNVVFKGTIPLYVDLGSFQKVSCQAAGRKSWIGYNKFLHDFVYPLKVASSHHGLAAPTIAQRVIGICSNDIDLEEYANLFGHRRRSKFINNLKCYIENYLYGLRRRENIKKVDMVYSYQREMRRLENLLDRYRFDDVGKWSDYQNDYLGIENSRFNILCNLLQKLDINSSFEVGGNQGAFSRILINRGIVERALCSDYDRGAIDKGVIYNAGDKSLYFAVYDLLDLTEAGTIERRNRFKSDIVIALALTHHLILSRNIRLQWIFERLKEYTRKYILIEFMPLGLGKGRAKLPKWYTLDWFKTEMGIYFDIIEEIRIDRKRIVILGKAKD